VITINVKVDCDAAQSDDDDDDDDGIRLIESEEREVDSVNSSDHFDVQGKSHES
jgi:hypothetical protein